MICWRRIKRKQCSKKERFSLFFGWLLWPVFQYSFPQNIFSSTLTQDQLALILSFSVRPSKQVVINHESQTRQQEQQQQERRTGKKIPHFLLGREAQAREQFSKAKQNAKRETFRRLMMKSKLQQQSYTDCARKRLAKREMKREKMKNCTTEVWSWIYFEEKNTGNTGHRSQPKKERIFLFCYTVFL